MKISVIGLGHLGLPLATLLAAAGHDVQGMDQDARLIARLGNGQMTTHEPGLKDLFTDTAARLYFTTSAAGAAAASDISIILVPTPADASGGYDAAQVRAAASTIGSALRAHDRPHLVVVMSTLMPGTMEGEIARVLRENSGRPVGASLGLCYSPVFGAIGSLLHDYRKPDFLLIGESSAEAGNLTEAVICSIIRRKPDVLRRSLLNAELAKIALNNYLIMKISFANMIGALCGRIPEADVGEVLSVLGHDRRVGGEFLRAAMPYGGPCFARDAGAMQALARRFHTEMPLAAAAEAVNETHLARLIEDIKAATPKGGRIAILGLAFRHATDVTAASPAVEIARQLAASGFRVTAWDPLARPAIGVGVTLTETLAACIVDADTAVITNDDPLCSALPGTCRKLTVFDYWRRLADGGEFLLRRFG